MTIAKSNWQTNDNLDGTEIYANRSDLNVDVTLLQVEWQFLLPTVLRLGNI